MRCWNSAGGRFYHLLRGTTQIPWNPLVKRSLRVSALRGSEQPSSSFARLQFARLALEHGELRGGEAGFGPARRPRQDSVSGRDVMDEVVIVRQGVLDDVGALRLRTGRETIHELGFRRCQRRQGSRYSTLSGFSFCSEYTQKSIGRERQMEGRVGLRPASHFFQYVTAVTGTLS